MRDAFVGAGRGGLRVEVHYTVVVQIERGARGCRKDCNPTTRTPQHITLTFRARDGAYLLDAPGAGLASSS